MKTSPAQRVLCHPRAVGLRGRPCADGATPPAIGPRVQRGATALAVVLLLLFVMTLGATFVNRNLVFEQRAAANQYASTRAFEAAEAGLQWAEAQLNGDRRLGADCLPTADPAAGTFRERRLAFDPPTALLTPRTWLDAGVPTPLQAACARSAAEWSCSCPSNGPTGLVRPAGEEASPAFSVSFLASGKPGVVRVVATGCSSAGAPCLPATGPADATARLEVSLGLLGSLRVAPSAAITAGGHVDAGAAVFGAAPVSIRAGGTAVAGRPSRDATADSTSGGNRVLEADPSLAAQTPARFFAASFGLGRSHWAAQPAATRVSCRSDCAGTLLTTLREQGGSAMLQIDGDLELSGPLVLGSTERPVLLVVDGQARLRGGVELHGVLYAGSVDWRDAPFGASVHGALLVEHDYDGNAAVEFDVDQQVLATLTGYAGSFARVAGSWRDF